MDAEKATVALKEVNHRQNIIPDLRRYVNEFVFLWHFFIHLQQLQTNLSDVTTSVEK